MSRISQVIQISRATKPDTKAKRAKKRTAICHALISFTGHP